jgi:hypothetical protein
MRTLDFTRVSHEHEIAHRMHTDKKATFACVVDKSTIEIVLHTKAQTEDPESISPYYLIHGT